MTTMQPALVCTYCQTTACHCPSQQSVLNCSHYLLDLPFIANCAESIVWETIDFSSRNLQSFDGTKLLSLRMKRLLLNSNSITDIANDAFDAVADILRELNLEMNQLTNVSSTWLNSKLFCLERLNLAANELTSFNHLHHVQLLNLTQLNLSRNQIEFFPNGIQQWTSLKELDLSFNKLSSIPRFALTGLNNLTWLSLASNRDLNCVIQDSFKYLKSLQYLDLSSTNLLDFDACIFIQLTGLQILRIEHVSFNCTSCWLPIARKKALELSGHCLNNQTIQSFVSLTDKQFPYACSKSSIDCSTDYCEPGSLNSTKAMSKSRLSSKTSDRVKTLTAEIIVGILFSIITLVIIILSIVLVTRWKQGRPIFCCHFSQTSPTIAEATRRRRQHHKQIIDSNPVVIESVVTHGANMNVPPYPHHNYAYFNDETSNNKRKLYNPMFADSPALDIRHQQQQSVIVVVSDDSISQNSQFYSEHL
ncbi:unnamed protein product [Adineta ricciae]|uniref:Uncharacterized protein n=1 Tax=Adineta ricciae TaxID=249248 RepID=A0A813RMA7_ADIRI|nr:unnamed protein product [Adineta ricciae]CAF0840507.1 unnamed protein product [Adineta ricciae]